MLSKAGGTTRADAVRGIRDFRPSSHVVLGERQLIKLEDFRLRGEKTFIDTRLEMHPSNVGGGVIYLSDLHPMAAGAGARGSR